MVRLGITLLFLSGCTVGVLRDDTLRYSGQITGNYSALARCVTAELEADKRWSINTLRYDVRIYPDNESAEITASTTAVGIVGFVGYAFKLSIMQQRDGYVDAKIVGLGEKESKIAWDYLTTCSTQGVEVEV